MSPLEAKARAWMDSCPMACAEYPDEVESLAALLSAVRREALEEAADACIPHRCPICKGQECPSGASRIRSLLKENR